MALNIVNKTMLSLAAAAMAVSGLAGTAYAQRDPAYAAARAAGQVGEQVDGYLGIVGSSTPALRDLVSDINIKRKAVYAERAIAEGTTAQAYALTSGCLAIARTTLGEKYQAPDGSWQTRTKEPPIRDSRCSGT